MEAGVRECHDRSERSGFEWNHYAGPGNRARVQHDCIRLNQCGGSFGVLQPVEKTFSITGTGETILAAKLELGTHQTLAHQDAAGNWVLNDPPPDKALELLKCQRYYQVFSREDLRPDKAVDFRPPMRIDPALSTIQINGVTYYTADANL